LLLPLFNLLFQIILFTLAINLSFTRTLCIISYTKHMQAVFSMWKTLSLFLNPNKTSFILPLFFICLVC
jgi:hypothetical protein